MALSDNLVKQSVGGLFFSFKELSGERICWKNAFFIRKHDVTKNTDRLIDALNNKLLQLFLD